MHGCTSSRELIRGYQPKKKQHYTRLSKIDSHEHLLKTERDGADAISAGNLFHRLTVSGKRRSHMQEYEMSAPSDEKG